MERREYLICVDSDGTAIDAMTVKHQRCFGPCIITVWGLGQWREPILRRWDEINLYSMDRGINRFRGLLKMLQEINAQYTAIEGLKDLELWCAATPAYSEAALLYAVNLHPEQAILRQALTWSRMANVEINSLPEDAKAAFPGVVDALAQASAYADIAVVSSANREAVTAEWRRGGLLSYVSDFMAQDVGTKEACLELLKAKGYDAAHVLMVGDAPGDLSAAQTAGVLFYPILAGKEGGSWKHFTQTALPAFLDGSYLSNHAQRLEREFVENLSGGKLP